MASSPWNAPRVTPIVLATACTRYPPTRTLLPDTPSTLAFAELADGRKVELRATPTPEGLRWVVQDKTGAATGVIVDRAPPATSAREFAAERAAAEAANAAVIGQRRERAEAKANRIKDELAELKKRLSRAMAGGGMVRTYR